uniref:Uncharacterized protein n=1 Tax=Cannabis sativa TaxID=3483 RepID=A0A803PA43_CANSA
MHQDKGKAIVEPNYDNPPLSQKAFNFTASTTPLEQIMSKVSNTTYHSHRASSSLYSSIDDSRKHNSSNPSNAYVILASNKPAGVIPTTVVHSDFTATKLVPLSISTPPAYIHLANQTNTNSTPISPTTVDSNTILVRPTTITNVDASESNFNNLSTHQHSNVHDNRVAFVFSKRQLVSSSGNVRQVLRRCRTRSSPLANSINMLEQPTVNPAFEFSDLSLKDDTKDAKLAQADPQPRQSPRISLVGMHENIAALSSSLQSWHHHKFGDLPRKIKSAHSKVHNLQDSYDTSPSHFSELHQSESILDNLLAQEEEYWQ